MIKKPNILKLLWASVKFIAFWLWIIPNIFVALFSRGGKFGVRQLRFFMRGAMFFAGIKVKAHGELSKKRPLLVVSNHISIFELATLPLPFGCSFFGKAEIASYPIVGYMSRKFGVVFVDRRPSKVKDALANVQKQMDKATWPMVLFPEGTSTNGAYVKRFKSSLFNFIEPQLNGENTGKDAVIQPIVICYRHKDGRAISDKDMAEHYALFNNRDMDQGPKCSVERSVFGQLFHIMAIGGFTVEAFVLPIPPLGGITDRKELADMLHKTISEKYMELKDKPLQK